VVLVASIPVVVLVASFPVAVLASPFPGAVLALLFRAAALLRFFPVVLPVSLLTREALHLFRWSFCHRPSWRRAAVSWSAYSTGFAPVPTNWLWQW
jgi:hypothetical protein